MGAVAVGDRADDVAASNLEEAGQRIEVQEQGAPDPDARHEGEDYLTEKDRQQDREDRRGERPDARNGPGSRGPAGIAVLGRDLEPSAALNKDTRKDDGAVAAMRRGASLVHAAETRRSPIPGERVSRFRLRGDDDLERDAGEHHPRCFDRKRGGVFRRISGSHLLGRRQSRRAKDRNSARGPRHCQREPGPGTERERPRHSGAGYREFDCAWRTSRRVMRIGGVTTCAARSAARAGLETGVPESRRRPTLPQRFRCSTIGAGGLYCRVRNGNGCGPSARVTGTKTIRCKLWKRLAGRSGVGTSRCFACSSSGESVSSDNRQFLSPELVIRTMWSSLTAD